MSVEVLMDTTRHTIWGRAVPTKALQPQIALEIQTTGWRELHGALSFPFREPPTHPVQSRRNWRKCSTWQRGGNWIYKMPKSNQDQRPELSPRTRLQVDVYRGICGPRVNPSEIVIVVSRWTAFRSTGLASATSTFHSTATLKGWSGSTRVRSVYTRTSWEF